MSYTLAQNFILHQSLSRIIKTALFVASTRMGNDKYASVQIYISYSPGVFCPQPSLFHLHNHKTVTENMPDTWRGLLLECHRWLSVPRAHNSDLLNIGMSASTCVLIQVFSAHNGRPSNWHLPCPWNTNLGLEEGNSTSCAQYLVKTFHAYIRRWGSPH